MTAAEPYARRLATLRDLERSKHPCSLELKQHFDHKRQQLVRELEAVIGKAMCPLCQPMYLETTRREHLRNCIPHSVWQLEILGRWLNSRPAGNVPSTLPSEPMLWPQAVYGEALASNSDSLSTRWTDLAKRTPYVRRTNAR